MYQAMVAKFSLSVLRLINYCRLYLQVETLSDILTINGYRIPKDAWNGKYHPIR
jgi:hypothetical protein